jgi:hypothetical protein
MQMFRPFRSDPIPAPRNTAWAAALFQAQVVAKGGVLRRAIRDVDREIGREAFLAEVRARGFHCIECGGQFIVICNSGHMQIHC